MAESLAKELQKSERRYREILSGATFSPSEGILPTREDFALVYKTLRNFCPSGSGIFSIQKMLSLFGESVGYLKLKVILSVLAEVGLCKIDEPAPNTYLIELIPTSQKADLSSSTILLGLERQLKNQL